jgi:hypothetical protein
VQSKALFLVDIFLRVDCTIVVLTIMNKELALALTPKLTSIPSILSSLYIMYKVHQDWRGDVAFKKSRNNNNNNLANGGGVEQQQQPSASRYNPTPVTRAVVGMSFFVTVTSSAWFISTWATPADDAGALPWAVGNGSTCRLQGFVLQLAIAAPMYNAAIILYSVLSILYRWPYERIRSIEPYVHGFIWTWCIGAATLLVSLDKIHSIGAICWASDPPECYDPALVDSLPSSHCNAKVYSTVLYCIPLWISLSFTVYGIVRIFWMVHVNHQGLKRRVVVQPPSNNATAAAGSGRSAQNSNSGGAAALRRSQDVVERAALLAILYSAAIFVTYTPCIIWSLIQWWGLYPYFVNFMYGLLEPLLGMYLFLLFVGNGG